MDGVDAALLELLSLLKQRDYRFVTPTPATHAHVLARPGRSDAKTLEDVLGWSLPFEPGLLPGDIRDCLRRGGLIEEYNGSSRSRVRVSSLHGELFLHSSYPTDAADSVFFGPDSYRFANLIVAELTDHPPRKHAHIVDIGTGAGVGAIVAAKSCPEALVTMTDINPKALRFAAINARAAGISLAALETSGLAGVSRPIDIAVINPPYIIDEAGRTYRDGGDLHGGELALILARESAGRLADGGRVILYTGSAIVAGQDDLRQKLEEMAAEFGCTMRHWEIDPDVFGDELTKPQYKRVERIALVAAVFTRHYPAS